MVSSRSGLSSQSFRHQPVSLVARQQSVQNCSGWKNQHGRRHGSASARRLLRTGLRAVPRRFFSAVSISTSCRRRARIAASAWVCSSGRGRGSGRMTSAKCANVWASNASVLASRPVALAKSRTCRGLTTTTGTPAAANTPVSGRLHPGGGFQHHQRRVHGVQTFENLSKSGLVVGSGELPLRSEGEVQLRLGDINTDKDLSTRHHVLLGGPALHDTGSMAHATVRARSAEGYDDPRCPTVFEDLGHVGLSCPG